MTGNKTNNLRELLGDLYRTESRRILATLIRLLGDFETAEDAMHEAFSVAAEKWPDEGVPANPRAWLVSTGRFKAIDQMRRRSKFETRFEPLEEELSETAADETQDDNEGLDDDRLRLIFTCCHPALAPESRTALTLREVCGLTTEEIAHAFLTNPPTLAQRIVRAKTKIRDAKIPYQVPSKDELPGRLETVLQVVYLIFNEGYSASSGDTLMRSDLSTEAIRLGRLLLELLPEPEVKGLLALMLLHESRRAARVSSSGDIILLEDQDRSLWDRRMIAEGIRLVEEALLSQPAGPYAVQAAISAVHAEAETAGSTDWNEIVALYGVLLRVNPSPIVELNRAVAVAMCDGPEAGLKLVNGILARGELREYHLAHSARAELCRRLDNKEEARSSYERAISLAKQGPERRFLEKRLRELEV